ncbi:MAG: DUF3071 domain-containing protein [Aeriscardovia sp.]|nr:DUF3071 domain-containing protein [Aeriscardovia sp.]
MKEAIYDHVDDKGNLILLIDNVEVKLPVTDRLEQGILSSHQIKTENRGGQMPPKSVTLPISQVQTMVREGRSYADIAEKYQMDESLVRRMADTVEQEKRSAIHQFLATFKSREDRRRLQDIISEKFTRAGLEFSSVEWSASRVRRDPWRIQACFPHDNDVMTASWTWNMHGGNSTETVKCLDDMAIRLLNDDQDTWLLNIAPTIMTPVTAGFAPQNVGGDVPLPSVTSLNAFAAAATTPVPSAAEKSLPSLGAASAVTTTQDSSGIMFSATAPSTTTAVSSTSANEKAPTGVAPSTVSIESTASLTTTSVQEDSADNMEISAMPISFVPPAKRVVSQNSLRMAVPPREIVATNQNPGSSVADGANTDTANTDGSSCDDAVTTGPKTMVKQVSKSRAKSRRRRCIPSWDDIIFGGR